MDPNLDDHRDIIKAINNEADFEALRDAIKREFLNKLGILSHNHYFVFGCSECYMQYYSPYDSDGGGRAIRKAWKVATRKLRLSGISNVAKYYSHKKAFREFEEGKRGKYLFSVGDLAVSDLDITCLCGADIVLLALQRNGNYMKDGKRIPEGARLFDELKERHIMECAGCPT